MKETKKYDNWMKFLTVSVAVIIVSVFTLTVINTHLAKETYGITVYTCPNGGELGSGAKAQTCIKTCYSSKTSCESGGWDCTENGNIVDGTYYYCEKAATITGATGCSDYYDNSCPLPKCAWTVTYGCLDASATNCARINKVYYNGGCYDVGSSCDNGNGVLDSSGNCVIDQSKCTYSYGPPTGSTISIIKSNSECNCPVTGSSTGSCSISIISGNISYYYTPPRGLSGCASGFTIFGGDCTKCKTGYQLDEARGCIAVSIQPSEGQWSVSFFNGGIGGSLITSQVCTYNSSTKKCKKGDITNPTGGSWYYDIDCKNKAPNPAETEFAADDVFYTCSGNGGNGGGGNSGSDPTPTGNNPTSNSTPACYLVNHKYVWSKSKPSGGTLVSSITTESKCSGCENSYTPDNNNNCVKPSSSSSSNVPVNPKTGTVGIIIAWFVGLAAIVYSLWYFKKSSSIK